MAQGQERRVAAETNAQRSLEAAGTMRPVQLGAGQIHVPRASTPAVVDTVGSRITNTFQNYVQGELGKAAKLQQQRSIMDGQVAAMQGQAMDQVEMGGDKWALEGYRVTQAQTLASSLLTAQRAEIASGAYEADPDTFRAGMMHRLEGMLSEAGDDRTAELVREQVMRQMPVLVEDHTVRHLQHREQQNFDSLVASVDTVSMDPTSADQLIAFATGGEGSATAGLSETRRHEAVASGVIQAFENDNPQAYAILSGSGNLDMLPHEQQQAIKKARSAFENRNRNKYNAEFITQETELMERLSRGELEPQQAMDMYGSLMAEHNMTMTQQEAGAIYGEARSGIRTRKINTAAATQEAMLRGDRQSAVNLIEQSLMGTESSGNPAAFRTNKDGRSYSGLLQVGTARLQDYNNATGSSVTFAQFKNMNAAEQRRINHWHINDILDDMVSKGYTDLVGQSVNGVSLTISGMVAVAHLGGKGGLDQFIRTRGQYNPSDELGTSLTDYLRKHGNGVEISAEATARQAADRIAVLREASAIADYERSKPMFDAADDAFTAGDLTEDQWRAQRDNIRAQFDIQQTMADAKFERRVVREVQLEAQANLQEEQSLEAGLKLEAAAEQFDSVVSRYAAGQATASDVARAQASLQEEQASIRSEYDIPLRAEEQIRQTRAQKNRVQQATRDRIQFGQEQAQIDAANLSGTLDELSPTLQRRAVQQASQRAMQETQDAIASGSITEEQAGDLHNARMMDFYTQSGVVDTQMERTLNGFLSAGLVASDGTPRPEYIEAAEQYRMLLDRNSAVADKYVRPENQPMLDAVLDLASGGPIEGAVRTLGVRQAQAPRTQSTSDFLADRKVVRDIDKSVSNYLDREEIGVAQAVTSRDADIQQVLNRSWFDSFGIQDEENSQLLSSRVQAEVARAYEIAPLTKPSELVSAAGRRVQERTPIIGGIAVPLPTGGPTAGEMFFGARASDFTDQAAVINDAVMDYFRTPEFREQYGFVDDSNFKEALPEWLGGDPNAQLQTLWTGVRPFITYYDNATKGLVVQFALPGGGHSDVIKLDTREIGRQYMKKHTAAAAN